jgi:hypothetical protein
MKKILNKILIAHQKIKHHNHVGSLPEIQRWFNICKSICAIQYINRIKDKYRMIISIDAERAFEKIRHP